MATMTAPHTTQRRIVVPFTSIDSDVKEGARPDLGRSCAAPRPGANQLVSGPRPPETAAIAWRAGVPEWGAGRWCDVFEVRDFLIQRCFIYLDPDYAGGDTARYPWLGQ